MNERLSKYKSDILGLSEFPKDDWVLELFRFQAVHNPVYNKYIKLLGLNIADIETVESIPFLPIELFKTFHIKTGNWKEEIYFTSSGTGLSGFSKHALYSGDFYKKHSKSCFEYFYGPLEDFCVLALLPSYLERQGSSLVYMCDYFIQESKHEKSGFYLDKTDELKSLLDILAKDKRKVLLIGVSFALLDFAEQYKANYANMIFMETGGMKGRRKEIPREELHETISSSFDLHTVHSEYGMTELLSQAYSKGNGLFYLPPTMHFHLRDITDPLSPVRKGKTGGLNIIDLANFSTISFIETSDLAKEENAGFRILGRMDNAMLRGCNLMYTEM